MTEEKEKIGYLYDELGEHMGYYCRGKIPRSSFINKIRGLESQLSVNRSDRTQFEGLKVSYMDFVEEETGKKNSVTIILWKTPRGVL